MLIFVKVVGIIILVEGIIFLLCPKALKKCVGFWAQGKRICVGAGLNILFGILFLLAASQCRVAWVVVTLGIMSLAKGTIIFIRGFEKTKTRLDWWGNRPLMAVRFIALIIITIGMLLLYSI